MPRFAKVGVVASMQPSHAPSDRDAADAALGERAATAYAWRTLLDAGAVLAFGSDAPIEQLDGLAGVGAAVARTLDERPPWRPEQAVTPLEALTGFTAGAAWAAGHERRRGRLTPGLDADLVVLDADPTQVARRAHPRRRRRGHDGRRALGARAAAVVSGTADAPSYRYLLTGPYAALVLGASGATFLASLDVLMVAPALPSAARDVGGIHLYALVVGIYSVMMTAGLPVGGALNDRRGVWPTLVLGTICFTCGSFVGATANEMWVVAGARALQGLGGGLLFSVPLAAIMQFLPAHLHRHALALNAATWSASALLGPPLGSLLTEVASWRLVFLVGLPPLALSVFLARRGLRGHVPAADRARPAQRRRPRSLLALVVLLLLLVSARTPSCPRPLFLWHERRAAAARLPAYHQRPRGLPPLRGRRGHRLRGLGGVRPARPAGGRRLERDRRGGAADHWRPAPGPSAR